MNLNNLCLAFFTLFFMGHLSAQTENENLVPVFRDGARRHYCRADSSTLYQCVGQKQRAGTYSDFTGFFSIVVEKGDTIEFSAVGYQTVVYVIPDDLKEQRYSLVQLMTQDTVNLPETVVFPWPSKEHFKLEFLAMDVTSEMEERALRNVANEPSKKMRSTVPSDGREHAGYYLRQQARDYYYIGQQPPMNIFNPIAWKQFFDAWQNGDYKKK